MTTQKKDNITDEIYFFGAADRKLDRDGEHSLDMPVTSQIPGWMQQAQIKELEEEISSDKANLARNKRFRIFDSEQVARQEEALEQKRERLELIKSSKPKMSAKDKDKYWKLRNEMGDKIRDALATKAEMHGLGNYSANEEANRMSLPVEDFRIDPAAAKSLNLKTDSKGRMNRTQMEFGYKILSAYFGEPTNIENLRRDRVSARSHHRGRR